MEPEKMILLINRWEVFSLVDGSETSPVTKLLQEYPLLFTNTNSFRWVSYHHDVELRVHMSQSEKTSTGIETGSRRYIKVNHTDSGFLTT